MILYVITSASFLLPHYVMGLVLLAPPGVRFTDNDDVSINLVDLDDAYDESWAIPMSLLDRPFSLPEQGDGTLIKDTLPRRRGYLKRIFKRRHHSDGIDNDTSSGILLPEVVSVLTPRSNQSLKRSRRSFTSHPRAKSIHNSFDVGEQKLSGLNGSSLTNHLIDNNSSQSNNSRGVADIATFAVTSRQQGSSSEYLLSGRNAPESTGSSVSDIQGRDVEDFQGSNIHDLSENRTQHLNNHHNKTRLHGYDAKLVSSNGATNTHDRRGPRHKRWASIRRIKLSPRVTPAPTQQQQQQPIIVRRRGRVDAKVGVLVVVENSIYRQYLLDYGNDPKVALARIRRYYGMVFAMMEQRFATIKDPLLSISVRISGILVAEKREESSWLEHLVDWTTLIAHGMGSVHTDKALKKFSKWVSSHRNLPEFDHAMVFTAYRLTIKQGIALGGMAYLNAICDTASGNAVSIVADRGDFQCVKVATHELAHSLGANHDGDKQSKTCRPDSNFIMSAHPSHEKHVLKNAFYFSPCSIREMSIHLSKPTSACVKNEPKVYYTYDLKRLPPGQVYSADMQCKLIFGKKSEFCREGNVLDVICGQLWCKDPQKPSGCRTNSYLTALPGTPCGTNRICHIGECVLDTKKNAILNDNTSGPIEAIPRIRQHVQPSFRMRGPRARETKRQRAAATQATDSCVADRNKKYCEGLLKVNPGGCRRRAVRQYCCATCDSRR